MKTKIFSGECQCSNDIYLEYAKELAMKRALAKLDDFSAFLRQKKLRLKSTSKVTTSCLRTPGSVVFTIVMNFA